MSDFFSHLMQETESERQQFLAIEILQKGVSGQISLNLYQAFLTQAYHHVKHTVPLLMACGSRLPEDMEWLQEATAEYIEEEIGHQKWILNDLVATGVDRKSVENGQPHAATELMLAYAYDLIARKNPVGFFGMVLVLEGTSVHLATNAAESLKNTLKLPDTAFSYLVSHGSLDISHMDHYQKLMNRLQKDEDKEAVIAAAKMFYLLYGNIFRSLT